MVGWIFIDGSVVAPMHRFEEQVDHGLVRFECSNKLLRDRLSLRREVTLEHHNDTRRRLVRCLTARRLSKTILIEAVDLGPASQLDHDHEADDVLAVQGQPVSSVDGVRMGGPTPLEPNNIMFELPTPDWRRLRGDRKGLLAKLPLVPGHPLTRVRGVQDLTPPLLVQPEIPTHAGPKVELIRLRERLRLPLGLYAADWGRDHALVLATVWSVVPIGRSARPVDSEAQTGALAE